MIAGGVTTKVTVILNCFELVPAALAAWTVNVEVPAAAGVPLITPVEEPRESPGGSAPLVTLQAIGLEPVAVRVCE